MSRSYRNQDGGKCDTTAGASCERFCSNVCQIFQPSQRTQCFFDCLACRQGAAGDNDTRAVMGDICVTRRS